MAEQLVDGMLLRVPMLVILGATGTGKSRLGIELARKFAGEIISADSMQVYKGLNILTAKVTKEEQDQARHHMLDIVDPLNEFRVTEFKDKAVAIIDDLLKRGKPPIIVGGTNYYIESLMWKILIDDPIKLNNECDSDDEPKCAKIRKIDEISNEELYNKLKEVDPEMAVRLHPNNRRKIIRSLEIFETHGMRHSEILKQQRVAGGCGLGGPLRYKNMIVFWLTCDQDILDERLNARVDTMMEAGLVQELLDFHERYNKDRLKQNELPDYSKGIFQSIGFKEFHKYLILPKEDKETESGQMLLMEGIQNLKIVTRRYARRQYKWLRNRLFRRIDRQVPPIYPLDCTHVEQWESEIYGKAVEIVSAIMRGEKPLNSPINANISNPKFTDSSNEVTHYCEVCKRTVMTDAQWSAHLKGMRHKKQLQKQKRFQSEEEKNKPLLKVNL